MARIEDIELVIPTEDMKFILRNCNAQSVVLLEVNWEEFNKNACNCSS